MSRQAFARSLVLGLILFALVPVLAAAPAAPAPPRDPDQLPLFPPPAPPLAAAAGSTAGPSDGLAPIDNPGYWTRVAFWAYVDGNVDLYTAMPSQSPSDPISRLTTSPAAELQPAISPDGQRLVYASDADGDFELYVADYEYSTDHLGPPVRLTDNDVPDLWPIWSPDGTRLAFYRVLGAEAAAQADVFVIDAAGGHEVNLSNHPAQDLYPSWSPDGARLAFASNRSGGARIHVMDATGGNVRQLSTQPGGRLPVWSRDGARIAYSADADGDLWLDLMLMNADGSGQTQLSPFDNQAQYDLLPRSWSPDGAVIAYTSAYNIPYQGTWYVYQTRLRGYNPDEDTVEYFAIDAGFLYDPDWQSIDHQPPVTSVYPLPAVSPGPFRVRWQGRDIGDAGLRDIELQMQIDDGPWTDVPQSYEGYSGLEIAGRGGQHYAFRVRGLDWAGNVEPWPALPDAMTTVENDPPATALDPLPAYTRDGQPIVIRWRGDDVGPSGLSHFDVQYRRDGDPWTNWIPATDQTEATFQPSDYGIQPGERVSFRVRGVDRAQNVEAWPGDGDAPATAIFSRRVRGLVSDNTGNPVSEATVAADLPIIDPLASGRDGGYAVHLGPVGSAVTLNWAKPGYGALPATTLLLSGDNARNAVLPPADNVLADGGFEDGWGAWQPGGAMAPTLTTEAHSGKTAAALGAPAPLFAAPVQLTHSHDRGEFFTEMVFDGDGRAVVVWLSGDSEDAKTLYTVARRADGSWPSPLALHDAAYVYDLAADPDGVLHLAAMHAGGISLFRQDGDGWTAGEPVPGITGFLGARLMPGADGQIDLFWFEPWSLFHMRRSGGVWGPVKKLSAGAASSFQGLGLARTADGAVHVLWYDLGAAGSFSTGDQIRYRRLAANGAWDEAVTLAAGPADALGLAADDAGRLHAIWLADRTSARPTLTYRRLSGGTWQPAETLWRGEIQDSHDSPFLQTFAVSPDGVAQALLWMGDDYDYVRREPGGRVVVESLSGNGLNGPTMVFDDAGNPHVAYVDDFGGDVPNVGYSARPESGDWLAPVQVSHDPLFGSGGLPAIDPLGRVHLLWHGGQSNYYEYGDLMYSGPLPAAAGGESILSRTVSVPAGMVHPVLSFMVASRGAVTLELAEETPTDPPVAIQTIPLPAAPAGYRHQWVDLSAYAGRTVTLTWRAAWAAGEPAAWALLDDVTLGAAHTDIGVTAASTGRLSGDMVVHTITVANDSALPAAGVTLSYTLPPQLAFVSADPAPVSTSPLRWELGALASGQAIVVRLTTRVAAGVVPPPVVASTAAITTTAVELELLNNTAAATTPMGRWARLPVIMRP